MGDSYIPIYCDNIGILNFGIHLRYYYSILRNIVFCSAFHKDFFFCPEKSNMIEPRSPLLHQPPDDSSLRIQDDSRYKIHGNELRKDKA